eukprot:m.81538 g.81538  ORF g.81538 m.81538 type:complete len:212 (+) comp12641_c0_seq1:177-812(+)
MEIPQLTIYPFANYTISTADGGTKKEQRSADARMTQLKSDYETYGLVRSVEVVMVVDIHGHPHVLVFQIGSKFYTLPGGQLEPGEDEVAGLKRLMNLYFELAPDDVEPSCILGHWYRPNFEPSVYPYVPAHVSKPKEEKLVVLLQLPAKATFTVNGANKLTPMAIMELYDNKESYGAVLASLPLVLSRLSVVSKTTADKSGVSGEANSDED